MKVIAFNLFLISLILTLSTCKDRRKVNSNSMDQVTYNFIILLDLSDRLLVRDQPRIDKELITYIYSLFEDEVKKKIFIYSKDKFRIVVAEQKDFTVDPILLQNELAFDLNNIDNDTTRNYIRKRDYMINFKNKFDHALDDLYKVSTIDTNSNQFKGSDLWKYFNQNLELDIMKGNGIKNYLFVFTDGYFDFEDYKHQKQIAKRYSTSFFLNELRLRKEKWEEKFDKEDYGLIAIDKKFENTSIIVLEVNPKVEFVDEFNLIEKMWHKWLKEMKIDKINILKKNRLETTKEQIEKFIQND